MSSAPDKAKDIFLIAVEQHAPDQWPSYLDEVCADDPELRRRVELLLEAHEGDESLLDSPAIAPPATLDQPITEKPGTQIGPYKLLQQLGEGGMGVVYMAEQKQPVKRRVALKIIKPGMDTRQVIARFEAERQALAMMDHPNIAKVLDAGATESGRPYFVMELVNGLPVTKYCDEQHLTPKERLELFVPICQAVQHAHQKGIIHRDLKPSNILVALYDGRPVPKVIDFGVAKATSQTLTEKTMFTQLGQVVGTLEYMSPEQAERNQLDIDTRSDIYSLGVVLYELLTGETPFDRTRLRSAAFDEMLRIIREEEPSKPSTKISSSQSLPSIAANRRIEPAKLGSMIRGELDWIVLKSMEKDRSRRYETASKFAEDVQHYLNDEAVVACPPSTAYKFRKFARRNKAAILTGGVMAASLLLGSVTATWQAIRASREFGRAKEAESAARGEAIRATREASRADAEAERAKTRLQIAVAINRFLQDDLLAMADVRTQVDAGHRPDPNISLRTVVDRAAAKIDKAFVGEPLVEAATRFTLGEVYRSLGLYEQAESQFERELKIRQRILGKEHPTTLESLTHLAFSKPNPREQEKLHQQVFEVRNRKLGPKHSDTLGSMANLANAIRNQGRYGEAQEILRRVMTDLRQVHGSAEHPDVLKVMNDLALTQMESGRLNECESLFRQVINSRKRMLGEEQPDYLSSLKNLAIFLREAERFEELQNALDKGLELSEAVFGAEHARTLAWNGLRACCLADQSRHNEAESLFRETLQTEQRALGAEHPQTLLTMNNLATALHGPDGRKEAEEIHRAVLEIQRRTLGPEHPDTLKSIGNLAKSLTTRGRLEEATSRASHALSVYERILGLEHPSTLWAMKVLSDAHQAAKRFDDAEQLLRKRWNMGKRAFGEESSSTLDYAYDFAVFLTDLGRPDEGEELHRKTLETCRCMADRPEHAMPEYLNGLANALLSQGRIVEAERVSQEADTIVVKVYGENHSKRSVVLSNIGIALMRQGRLSEAKAQHEKALGILETASIRFQLGLTLSRMGQRDEAIKQYKRAIELDPGFADAHTNLGILFVKTDEPEQAVHHFQKALEAEPNEPDCHKHLGMALRSLGRLNEAAEVWERGLEFAPHADFARSFVSMICRAPDRGVLRYQRALRVAESYTNGSAKALDWQTLGWAFYRNGDWRKAIKALEKSVALQGDGGDPHQWFFLAMAHWKLEEKIVARNWFDRSVFYMETNKRGSAERVALRDETEKLFGLSLTKEKRQAIAAKYASQQLQDGGRNRDDQDVINRRLESPLGRH